MSELEPTAGEGQRWRWEWAGTPAAERVAVWMRTGHGHDGALHALVLYLATSRLCYAGHLDWAFRPLWELEEVLVGREPGASLRELLGVLEVLEVLEVVECRAGDRGWWRASALAAEAIEESYADRSPLVDDAGAPRRP